MKNTEFDFRKLKENTQANREKGKRRQAAYKAFKTYGIYPVTLFCLLFGLIFTLEDGISMILGGISITTLQNVQTSPVTEDDTVQETLGENIDVLESPYVIGLDDSEPLALTEYYYLNRDVLPDDIYGFNYNLVPEGHLGIIPISLAKDHDGEKLYIKNSTSYDIDTDDYKSFTLPEYEETDGYTVLIVHTHGTEAYTPDGVLSDDPDDPYSTRSSDNTENVVSVGAVMAEIFEENGIKTLHRDIALDTTVDDYSKAYSASEKVIKDALKEHPSIKYVFDIHRDGLMLSSGEKAKVICEVDGKLAAQIMCVVGTDSINSDHTDWEENLSFALLLQRTLEEKYTDLCRPSNIKKKTYNQQYSPYSLLLEMGTDGNTLEEARYTAEIVAKELCRLIKDQ